MKSISLLCGSLLFFATILVACTSNSPMGSSEKQQIVEHVKTVEESEFDLIYFNKSYKQYHNAINEIVSEKYWVSMSKINLIMETSTQQRRWKRESRD